MLLKIQLRDVMRLAAQAAEDGLDLITVTVGVWPNMLMSMFV